MAAIVGAITNRIRRKGRGWVFTPKNFLDIATATIVTQALSKLVKQRMICRLGRDIYDYPKKNKLFGTLSPTAGDIARALAFGDRVFPSGAMAANLLGISTQVPAKPCYLTNATTLTRKVGNYTIKLERAQVPLLDNVGEYVNLVIQALFYFGEHNIDDHVIDRCERMMTDCDLSELRCSREKLPGWMSDVIRKIERVKYKLPGSI